MTKKNSSSSSSSSRNSSSGWSWGDWRSPDDGLPLGSDLGLWIDVPDEAYRSAAGMNQSSLKWARRSMAHMRAYMNGQLSPANRSTLLFGSLCHTLTLEPHLQSIYAVQPDFGDLRKSANKAERDEWMAINSHRTVVTQKQWDEANAIADRVRSHPAAGDLLKVGVAEVTAFAELCGVRCKGRIDWMPKPKRKGENLLVDLKTTTDSSYGFAKSIANFGYDMQAAFYLDMFEAITGQTASWVFIAVEKEPPYEPAVYRLNEESVEAGREKYQQALADYAYAVENDEYRGYSDEIRTISLPAWAM